MSTSIMMVATASAVSSEVFAGLALLVLSLIVLLILRHYLPLRTTPAYLLVPVFFALWLPAGIVLLVPIDLASGARTDDVATRGIWLPENVLRASWRITYWLTFALTWCAKPAACRMLLSNVSSGLYFLYLANTPMRDTESPKPSFSTPSAKMRNTMQWSSAPASSGWSMYSYPPVRRRLRS